MILFFFFVCQIDTTFAGWVGKWNDVHYSNRTRLQLIDFEVKDATVDPLAHRRLCGTGGGGTGGGGAGGGGAGGGGGTGGGTGGGGTGGGTGTGGSNGSGPCLTITDPLLDGMGSQVSSNVAATFALGRSYPQLESNAVVISHGPHGCGKTGASTIS